MYRVDPRLAFAIFVLCGVAANAQVPPGARPANTTANTGSGKGVGKPAKVKPTASPTDPTVPMETTAPVDKNGAVPAERDARNPPKK